jgi:hypothetical protein
MVTPRHAPVHASRLFPRPPTQEYEELAVALGTDHARREGLRARLKAGRLSSPLFDTDTWVRPPAPPRACHATRQPALLLLQSMAPSGWHPALQYCRVHGLHFLPTIW